MIRVIFLLSVFTLVSRCAFAQTDFRPGLVILLNGDTLKGEIDYRGDEMMGMICRFRSTDTPLREYRPVDLRAYQFTGGKYYISRDVKRNNGLLERAFLEYVIGGKVTFYYIRELEGGERFFLDKDGAGFTELTYNEKLEFREGKQVKIQSTTHIGLLNFYLKEAPKLQDEISKIERPNRAQLTKVIHEYHTIIDKEKGAIVFQEKFPGTQIFMEPLIGSSYYKGTNLNTNYSFIGGLNVHLGMPRYNEKLFFRTGISFSRFNFSEGAEMFYKVPLSLEYMPMKRKINPRAAYAVNIYSTNISSVAFSLGLNMRMSERLFIAIVPEVEFNDQAIFAPKDFLGYNVQLGLNLRVK